MAWGGVGMVVKKEEFFVAFQTCNNELLDQSFVIFIINGLKQTEEPKTCQVS